MGRMKQHLMTVADTYFPEAEFDDPRIIAMAQALLDDVCDTQRTFSIEVSDLFGWRSIGIRSLPAGQSLQRLIDKITTETGMRCRVMPVNIDKKGAK
jgi:hypothetical protein